VDGVADGATNMALDEAILVDVVAGASPPTLRFYAWSPPCLSLGRNQPLSDVDLVSCHADGVDVVRRPTGGRAILHTDELTYSVSLLQTDPLAAGGVLESYRRLSEGLLAGLRLLGARVSRATGAPIAPSGRGAGQPSPVAGPTAVCFETPSDYEITVSGRKLVGSAQWRAQGGVLQHGTLPLCGDITRILNHLSYDDNERESQRAVLRGRATTLEEALGYTRPFIQVAGALAKGFAQALDLEVASGEISARERARAADLRRRRYASADWTGRV
jgi:lipoate-protein ligase A